MKFIKRLIISALILSALGLICREWIYNHLITYKTIGIRQTYKITGNELKEYIDSGAKFNSKPDIYQIVKASQEMTVSKLNFTTGKNDLDPNKLVKSENGHCVGYANFFVTTCNYLLNKHGLEDEWMARTQIGQLYIFGNNINAHFSTPFLKDHDFGTIENRVTGEVLAVDPSLNDYFHIDSINFEK